MRNVRALTLILLGICSSMASAQLSTVRARIDSIARHARGQIGVTAIDLDTGDTLTVHRNRRFPMQSVFKFPLALAVLHRVDQQSLPLDTVIQISRAELVPHTWSPLRDSHPAGAIALPLDSLLYYTVAYSDNIGCDILFRLVGGTPAVDQYVHALGIEDISIAATEAEMHQDWQVQYQNWSSPFAMARLLRIFSDRGILSPPSRNLLWHFLVGTSTAGGRIKGLLPSEAVVAHKSGSSGTNADGVAAATNDVGIIMFPDGRRVALVVFVSDSNAPDEERDGVIASIARSIWDAYTAH